MSLGIYMSQQILWYIRDINRDPILKDIEFQEDWYM